MVNLGLWQLRRLDEKRDRNALIEARSEQPVTPVGELLDPGDDHATVEAVRHRSVTATGTYDDDATVAVRNRTQDGVAGAWLVTPLHLEGGERVGVIRGFVGLAPDGSVVDRPAPWLVPPPHLGGGGRVGVIRGFVGLAPDGSVVAAPAPAGEVTVKGAVV